MAIAAGAFLHVEPTARPERDVKAINASGDTQSF